jgi:hypothetical protein
VAVRDGGADDDEAADVDEDEVEDEVEGESSSIDL